MDIILLFGLLVSAITFLWKLRWVGG